MAQARLRDRRIGKFYVGEHLVRSGQVGKWLALMEFTPMKVEPVLYNGMIEFTGISPLFDELPDGQFASEYQVTVFEGAHEPGVGVTKID